MDTPEQPAPAPEKLGYFFSPSGLNNQKLALLGLVLRAITEGPRRMTLPALCNYDLRNGGRVPVPLGQVFNVQPLAAFLARRGVEILWNDAVPGTGEEFFADAPRFVQPDFLAGNYGPDHPGAEFHRCLVPHLRHSRELRRLSRAVFQERGIRIVAQLRIERDWTTYAETHLNKAVGPAEDNTPGFQLILEKIRASLPGWEAGVYAVCDEGALPLPKEEIREIALRDHGVRLHWKSDFLPEFADMLAIEASILDFEMAGQAPSFVGLSRSTFSNLAAQDLFARTRRHVRNHYLYNIPGPALVPRLDNGMRVVAVHAAQPATFHGVAAG